MGYALRSLRAIRQKSMRPRARALTHHHLNWFPSGASAYYTITGDIIMILTVDSPVQSYTASVGGSVRPMVRGTGIRVR